MQEIIELKKFQKMTGTIKSLTDKGFGFIKNDEGEYFFHQNSLLGIQYDELREGDIISFDIEKSQKGLTAIKIQRV